MTRFATAVAFFLLTATLVADLVEARGRGRRRGRTYYSSYTTNNVYSFGGNPQEVAEAKAEYQATHSSMFHPGGGFGGGNAEGVGAGVTPQQALNNCCFTGQRLVLGQAVCQGTDGRWYACKIYQ